MMKAQHSVSAGEELGEGIGMIDLGRNDDEEAEKIEVKRQQTKGSMEMD